MRLWRLYFPIFPVPRIRIESVLISSVFLAVGDTAFYIIQHDIHRQESCFGRDMEIEDQYIIALNLGTPANR